MFVRNLLALALLAFALIQQSSAIAQDAESKTIELTIVADEMPPEEKRHFRVDKDVKQIGEEVENVRLRVNEKTLGLADVFASTRAKELIENKEPKSHTVTFQDGNFHPPALIASKGDRLRVVNKSKVGINPKTAFKMLTPFGQPENGADIFLLDELTGFPVELHDSVHGWVMSMIFVQNRRACSLTDREGKCRVELLPGKEVGERSQVQIWHSSVDSLTLKEPTPGVEVTKNRRLEIDFNQVVDGQKLLLVAKLMP